MKNTTVIIIVILALGLSGACIYAWAHGVVETTRLQAQIDDLEQRTSDAGNYQDLKKDYDELVKKSDEQIVALESEKQTNLDLARGAQCDIATNSHLSIDYTSNDTVLEGLKAFSLEIWDMEAVEDAYWESFWEEDVKTALHTVKYGDEYGSYSDIFVAFFEDDNGPAIFWINKGCFLDH